MTTATKYINFITRVSNKVLRATPETVNTRVIVILAAIGLFMTFGSAAFDELTSINLSLKFEGTWWSSFLQNFGTEMYGALLTFWLIEIIVDKHRRQAQEEALENAEKERLILQMGSPFNEFAVEAARQLRWRGWLFDGTLNTVDLEQANLAGANLLEAELQNAYLWKASLPGANLRKANLQDANLLWANLENADLIDVKLKGANLTGVSLKEAHLQSAHLEGANLTWANLRGANMHGLERMTLGQLKSAKTLESATLPDGTNLPGRKTTEDPEPDWRTPFQAWCDTVETDENGFIIPAPLDDDSEVEEQA